MQSQIKCKLLLMNEQVKHSNKTAGTKLHETNKLQLVYNIIAQVYTENTLLSHHHICNLKSTMFPSLHHTHISILQFPFLIT